MPFISALLFSISANIDTFVLGLSYGIKKLHISLFTNFIISLITFLGTLLSIGMGYKLALLIPLPMARIAGNTLLILLGLFYCLKCLIQQRITSVSAASASLTGWETAALGMTLTINNAAMGIGASFAGIHFILTSGFTFLFSALFLIAGNRLGRGFSVSFPFRLADLISGLIMIVLGMIQMLVSF